jgi:hypothetical protein
MRWTALCGVRPYEPRCRQRPVAFRLCIIRAVFSDAISLSVALKRPERSFGATIDSSASSFTEGSMRVYISVVCMLAWPSHRETLRKSLVACKTVSAQVCRLCLRRHRRHYVPFLTISGNLEGLLEHLGSVGWAVNVLGQSPDIVSQTYKLFRKSRSWSAGR